MTRGRAGATPGLAVGVDVGGTKIAVGLVDRDGARGGAVVAQTVRGDGAANTATVRRLVTRAADVAGRRGEQVCAIGLSVTTTIDRDGRLRDASDWLGWAGLTADEIVGAPATAANDALCGAVAEDTMREAPAHGTLLYVTLGTGIAHTVVHDGVPQAGAHGAALFSAWAPAGFDDAGRPRATWERLAAGPALAERYDGGRDARPLVAAARRGEERARRILAEGARWFGGYLATVVQSYDPDLVVIGGGLADGVPEYVDLGISALRDLVRQPVFAQVPVERARLGGDSGWVGAGLLALRV